MPRFIQLLDCDFTLVNDHDTDAEQNSKDRNALKSKTRKATARKDFKIDNTSVAKATIPDTPDPLEYEGLGLEVFGAVNGRRESPPWRRRVFRGKRKVRKVEGMGGKGGDVVGGKSDNGEKGR
ncbi:MAG: hypothetical protein LQ350_007551 [Teloschistes chrysophthalmus]|nr:MAG: hypothetical protein LQ350_007551 [Niorma chrysophthalma]